MSPTAYRHNARGLRDRQAFEGVRMQAGALFAAGRSQAQVAHQLGVARQNVSRWHGRWQAGGQEALRSAGPTGTAPRLSDQQLREGARAHGFDTDHWTLARTTTVIERLTGVGYHPGHVWKLLRHRLHYRLQRPARRALERDEQAIARQGVGKVRDRLFHGLVVPGVSATRVGLCVSGGRGALASPPGSAVAVTAAWVRPGRCGRRG
jgi:transposase